MIILTLLEALTAGVRFRRRYPYIRYAGTAGCGTQDNHKPWHITDMMIYTKCNPGEGFLRGSIN